MDTKAFYYFCFGPIYRVICKLSKIKNVSRCEGRNCDTPTKRAKMKRTGENIISLRKITKVNRVLIVVWSKADWTLPTMRSILKEIGTFLLIHEREIVVFFAIEAWPEARRFIASFSPNADCLTPATST